jgi:hypothetical protein
MSTVEQTIEAELWVACVDHPRDWTETERQWIANQYEFEHNLIEWWLSDASEGCFTPANAEFITQRLGEYPRYGTNADEMDTPSAGSLPPTE